MEAVADLAGRHEASIQATARRFVQLWPEPVLLVSLEMGLRKSERNDPQARPKLRVVSTSREGTWQYVPINKSPAANGALTRAIQGEDVSGTASLAELALPDPGPLDLSARAFTYSDGEGHLRRRVLALYR